MKYILRFMAIAVFAVMLFASHGGNTNFLSTVVSCAQSSTTTITTDTDGINVTALEGLPNQGLITIIFTRDGAGTADEVDFEFQVSYDGGTTWTTAPYVTVSVATNARASSSIVRHSQAIHLYGASHIRASFVVNASATTNLTLCQAVFSWPKK